MDVVSPSSFVAICSVSALVLGVVIGAWVMHRLARRARRRLERTLARRELALLDARGDSVLPTLERGDRPAHDDNALLTIMAQQLDEARMRSEGLHAALDAQERHHTLALAKLKLAAVRARNQARRALDAQLEARPGTPAVVLADRRSGTAPMVHERRVADHERRVAHHDRRARSVVAPPGKPHNEPVAWHAPTRESSAPVPFAAAANHARARSR